MATAIPQRRYTLSDENHYILVLDDMKELDVDIFVAIKGEAKKSTPDRKRLKKLEALQTVLRGELKLMSIEDIESVNRVEKVLKKVLNSFKKLI